MYREEYSSDFYIYISLRKYAKHEKRILKKSKKKLYSHFIYVQDFY